MPWADHTALLASLLSSLLQCSSLVLCGQLWYLCVAAMPEYLESMTGKSLPTCGCPSLLHLLMSLQPFLVRCWCLSELSGAWRTKQSLRAVQPEHLATALCSVRATIRLNTTAWLWVGSGFGFGSGSEHKAQLELHRRHTLSLRHAQLKY